MQELRQQIKETLRESLSTEEGEEQIEFVNYLTDKISDVVIDWHIPKLAEAIAKVINKMNTVDYDDLSDD